MLSELYFSIETFSSSFSSGLSFGIVLGQPGQMAATTVSWTERDQQVSNLRNKRFNVYKGWEKQLWSLAFWNSSYLGLWNETKIYLSFIWSAILYLGYLKEHQQLLPHGTLNDSFLIENKNCVYHLWVARKYGEGTATRMERPDLSETRGACNWQWIFLLKKT